MSAAPAHDPRVLAPVVTSAAERGITQVLHFTTSRGLVGILAKRAVLARSHLTEDLYLEHIYRPNASNRYEAPKYQRYVNMSITRVNERFFSISRNWHKSDPYLHWAVLSFAPDIIGHEGVLFATSNMMHDGVVPQPDTVGFNALFANPAHDGYGRNRPRHPGLSDSESTNNQAELLYPDCLSTTYLRRVYVDTEDDAANVEGIVGVLDHDGLEVVVEPGMFGH